MTVDKPAYATIAALGGYYTVQMYARKSKETGSTTTSTHSGYSEEVFDQYRGSGIPVIDYRTVDSFSGYGFPTVRDCTVIGAGMNPKNYCTLEEKLERARNIGATITYL